MRPRQGLKRYRAAATIVLCLALALGSSVGAKPVPAEANEDVALHAGDRLLVLAPHPDDEVAGCGGLILRARDLRIPLRIAFLTNGDSNEGAFLTYRGHPVVAPSAVIAMGRAREAEARRAESVLGVPASDLSFLGYPDRGTLSIWLAHWGERPPLRGLLTRATSVPYAIASRPGAPYKGGAILADLEREIASLRPTKVCLSSPADRHPDHAALYLFTRVALWHLGMEPQLLPYLVHYPRWPKRALRGEAAPVLPPPALRSVLDWRTFRVPPADRRREFEALLRHRSQMRSIQRLLGRLVSADELFGIFPRMRLDPLSETRTALTPVLPFRAQWPRSGPGALRLGLSANGTHLFLEAPAPELHVGRVAIDLIGFSPERAFATMPKIEIHVSETGIEIYSGGVREAASRSTIAKLGRILRIDLPLSLLGEPDRLFISARSSAAHLLIDQTPWRVVWLNGTPSSLDEARSESKGAKAK